MTSRDSLLPVVSETAWATLGVLAQGGARFLYTLAIARIAGPERMADVSAVLSIAVTATLLWPAAAGIAATRFSVPRLGMPRAISILAYSLLPSGIILGLLSALVAWWITGQLPLGLGAALLTVTSGTALFSRGALLGQQRARASALLEILGAGLALGTLLAVFLVGPGSAALLLPLALGYSLTAWLGWPTAAIRHGTGSGDFPQERRAVLGFTRATSLGLLATGALLPLAMILVRANADLRTAGIFAAAVTLATPLNLVAQAGAQVLLPVLGTQATQDPAPLGRLFRRVFSLSAFAFALGFATLILLAPWLLAWIFGPAYSDGVAVLRVLLLSVGLLSVATAPNAYLLATGRHRTQAGIWSGASVTGAISMLLGLWWCGSPGILWGYFCGCLLGTILVSVSALRGRAPGANP